MQAHRNAYVQNEQCPAPVGGGLKVTRTVKRETLNMFNRDSLVNTARERAVPSGGAYPDCEDASDDQCCLALHQVSYDKDSAADVESGCEARCLLERRTGFEHACLPGHDECMDAEAADGRAWDKARYVKVMCFCGGRFSIDPADNQPQLKEDGEDCEADEECTGTSICFNRKCRPPGIECDACEREVDCDVGNARAFGVFKCAYGQCIYDGSKQAPDGHACLNNADCQSNDCATYTGDTGTNLLTRYCRSQANGICGVVNTQSYDQLGHPIIGYDVAHIGYHCWGDKMGNQVLECSDPICTECMPSTQTCQTGFDFPFTCSDGCRCNSGICHPSFNQCTHESGSFAGNDGDACTAADQCKSQTCAQCYDPLGARCYTKQSPATGCSDNCMCSSGTCYTGQCTYETASFAGPAGAYCTAADQCRSGLCGTCGSGDGIQRCYEERPPGSGCSDDCMCTNSCQLNTGRCLYTAGAPTGAVCTSHTQCDSGRCDGLSDSQPWGNCARKGVLCEGCYSDVDCGVNMMCYQPPGYSSGSCISSSGGLGGEACAGNGNCASGKCATWFGAGEWQYCASAGTGASCGGGSQRGHCFGYGGTGGNGCSTGPCISGSCLDNAICRDGCNAGSCPGGYVCSFIAGQSNKCFFNGGSPGGNACQANEHCASGVCVDWVGAFQRRFCAPLEGEPCGYDIGVGTGKHTHCFGQESAGTILLGSDCHGSAPYCVATPEGHDSGTPALGVCSTSPNVATHGRRMEEVGAVDLSDWMKHGIHTEAYRRAMSVEDYGGGYTHVTRNSDGTNTVVVVPFQNNTVFKGTISMYQANHVPYERSFGKMKDTFPPPPPPAPSLYHDPPPPLPSPPPSASSCEEAMRTRTNSLTMVVVAASLNDTTGTSSFFSGSWCNEMRKSTFNCNSYYSMQEGSARLRMCDFPSDPSSEFCELSPTYYVCDSPPPVRTSSSTLLPSPSPLPLPPPNADAEELGRRHRKRQLDRVVDPLMGDHLKATDQCRSDLMEFKLRFFRLSSEGGTACDYDNFDPYTSIAGGAFPTCDSTLSTDTHYDSCCVTDRHADHRSMYYISKDSTGQSFENGVPIGENVYGGRSAAMITADLNGDGFEELLMADGVYINHGGTFSSKPDVTFAGVTAWKRLYVADMDARNTYPDIIGLDVTGRAYMMRSSVPATPMQTSFQVRFDTSVQTGKPAFRGNYMVECVLQDPACSVSTDCPSQCYQPFYYNTISEFDVYVKPDAYPVWRKGDRLRATSVVAADLAGSTCDGDKFLNNDLEVVRVEHFDMDTVRRDVASEHADASWIGSGQHNPHLRTHHRLRLRFVDRTVCTAWPMGPNGYWNPAITTLTLTGTPKLPGAMVRPTPGQTPTFFHPQRIGGVDDVGAVDIAAIDVLSHKGTRDTQKDVCLLFRGRPIKCYVLPEMPVGHSGQLVYDASNVMDVVMPDTFDDMHDAIQFARITSSGAGRSFTAPGWQFEGEFLVLNWEDDVMTPSANERVPPGVTAGSVIEITSWDATFDVSFLLERNKGRFYVEEAGEFFIKFRTGTANWRYVDGSYNPCDSVETGTVYDRTVDEACADPVWIQQANKVPRCDVHGPICKRGTDHSDCASLGYGSTVAFDATYASVQTLGADDDSCAYANNGYCTSCHPSPVSRRALLLLTPTNGMSFVASQARTRAWATRRASRKRTSSAASAPDRTSPTRRGRTRGGRR